MRHAQPRILTHTHIMHTHAHTAWHRSLWPCQKSFHTNNNKQRASHTLTQGEGEFERRGVRARGVKSEPHRLGLFIQSTNGQLDKSGTGTGKGKGTGTGREASPGPQCHNGKANDRRKMTVAMLKNVCTRLAFLQLCQVPCQSCESFSAI